MPFWSRYFKNSSRKHLSQFKKIDKKEVRKDLLFLLFSNFLRLTLLRALAMLKPF